MTKEELIKDILQSPNLEEEMTISLDSGIINHTDILSEEEIQNLNNLFGTVILEKLYEYDRFPLFYRVKEVLDDNEIDLNKFNLQNDEERIYLLDILFKTFISLGNYTLSTPRILWELYMAISQIYEENNEPIDLSPLFEVILEIAGFLYEQNQDRDSLNNYERLLLEIAPRCIQMGQMDKLIKFYQRIFDWLESVYDTDMDLAIKYLSDLATLISFFIRYGDDRELDHYLKKYINSVKHYSEHEDQPFIPINLSLSILASSISRIADLKGKTRDLVEELTQFLENLSNDKKLSVFDQENLYLDLGFLYFALGNFSKVKEYLIKEEELVTAQNAKRDMLTAFNLFDLVTRLEEKVTEDERDNVLKDIYKVENDEELLAYITNNELKMPDFMANAEEEVLKEEFTSPLEKDEAIYEDLVEEEPNLDNTTTLAIIKLSVALDYITEDDYDRAERKLDEVSPLIEDLKKYNNQEVISRIEFEKELLSASISFLENKDENPADFVDKISGIIEENLKDFKESKTLINPLTPLLKITAVLIKEKRLEAALLLLKKIDSLFKEFPGTQKKKDSLKSFNMLLFNIRSLLKTEEVEKWTDEKIRETLERLSKLDLTPEEFIRANFYLIEGQEEENDNEDLKALNSYQKAVEAFKLYLKKENAPLILEKLGQVYFLMGKLEKELKGEKEAVKSFRKSLSYLDKLDIKKEDTLRLLTFLSASLFLSEYYIQNKEFDQAAEVMEKQYELFKNVIGKPKSDSLLYTYLNTLDHLYISYQQLGKPEKQEEIFKSAIELLDPELIQFESFSNILVLLSSFLNIKHNNEMKSAGPWNLADYIEEIYDKYKIIDDKIYIQDYDIEVIESVFSIYFAYLDYLLTNHKSIPVDLIEESERLCSLLISRDSKKRDDLKEASQFLRLLKARFS